MELSYSFRGDYWLPDIILNEPPPELVAPLGRYGRMRKAYLKEHRPIQYTRLLLSEQLFPHLRKVDADANEWLETLIAQLVARNPPPDKAPDGLAWAAHMAEIKRIAEETVSADLIYC